MRKSLRYPRFPLGLPPGIGLLLAAVLAAAASIVPATAQSSPPAPPSMLAAYLGLPVSLATSLSSAAGGFQVSGFLPPGLSFNSATGVLAGTPDGSGIFDLTIAADNGSTVQTWPLAVTVTSPVVSFATLANAAGTGLAEGPDGTIYVTSQSGDTVSKITGGAAIVIAGAANALGYVDGAGGAARFNGPTGIAADSHGNLYVVDNGNSTIRKISPAGQVSTLAGSAGVSGDTDGAGAAALFNHPTSIAVDAAGNLYVSDTLNSAIRKIDANGTVTTLASAVPGGIALPRGIAIDAAGYVYVMNSGTASLLKISPAGIVTTLATGLTGIYTLGAGIEETTPVNGGSGVAVDPAGDAFVLLGLANPTNYDNIPSATYLVEISPHGEKNTVYTWSALNASPTSEPTIDSYAIGITVDPNGNLLLAGSAILEAAIPYGPVITGQPQSVEATPGQSASFSVSAVGAPAPLAYQWQLNGASIPGATAATLSLPMVTTAQAGAYTVTVTTAEGSVISAPALLGVASGPVILVQPQNQSAEQSGQITLSVVASAGASYQWQFNGQNLTGASLPANIAGTTTPMLTISAVAPDEEGNYTVVVTLGGRSVTSNPAFVRVYFDFPPPTIISTLTSQRIDQDSSATFTSPYGVGDYDLQWEKDGLPIPGATGTTYTISDAQPSDGGTYTVVATGAYPIASSPVVTLGVNVDPGATYLNIWSASAPLSPGVQYTSVAFDGARFLAAGAGGSLFQSADGATWTPLPSAPGQINSLLYAGAPYGFLGVGNNGLIVSFAGPAYAPVAQPAPTTQLLTGIAIGGGRMVAVGYAGTALSSAFAAPGWAAGFTGTAENLNAVAYGNGVFVAVGLNATVLTSPDGLLWSPQTLNPLSDLYSVAYGAAGFVAIGDSGPNGVIYTSPDGVAWTQATAPASAVLVRVIYANGTFVAVGAAGAIFTSADGGFTWGARSSGTSSTLEGAAYGLDGFVAVGGGGTVSQTAPAAARLGNISARGFAGAGGNNLIAGFVTAGTASKQVLIRGIGPTLSQFGVSGVLANPQLTLLGGNSVPIAANAGWGGGSALATLFSQLGAFALSPASADAALLQTLPPGSYTAEIAGANDGTGTALAEVYDVDRGTPASRLVNLSARALVTAGVNNLIAGFVVSGNTAETVLIRGVGPGLGAFGVANPLPNPVLSLYDSGGNLVASNTAWGGTAALASTFAQVGAFGLPVNSDDTALLAVLAPGAYTAVVSDAVMDISGVALVEIYEVP